MKRLIPSALAGMLLGLGMVPAGQAMEILRWERLPLAVPLVVGQERVLFIDRNVRIGVPAGVDESLRVQSAGGAIYLRASKPIPSTRLQLQDVESGALILLDIAAEPAKAGQAALEPVRIVEGEATPAHSGEQAGEPSSTDDDTQGDTPASGLTPTHRRETPVAVVLTRYAAQNLYAPLRTVEPVAGIGRVNLRRDLVLDTLLPTLSVRARALAAWRLDDQWVTAVRLTNTTARWLDLDPNVLVCHLFLPLSVIDDPGRCRRPRPGKAAAVARRRGAVRASRQRSPWLRRRRCTGWRCHGGRRSSSARRSGTPGCGRRKRRSGGPGRRRHRGC